MKKGGKEYSQGNSNEVILLQPDLQKMCRNEATEI